MKERSRGKSLSPHRRQASPPRRPFRRDKSWVLLCCHCCHHWRTKLFDSVQNVDAGIYRKTVPGSWLPKRLSSPAVLLVPVLLWLLAPDGSSVRCHWEPWWRLFGSALLGVGWLWQWRYGFHLLFFFSVFIQYIFGRNEEHILGCRRPLQRGKQFDHILGCSDIHFRNRRSPSGVGCSAITAPKEVAFPVSSTGVGLLSSLEDCGRSQSLSSCQSRTSPPIVNFWF